MKVWFTTVGRLGAAALAVIATIHSLLLVLVPDIERPLSMWTWIIVAVCLVSILVVASVRGFALRERTFRTDPNHGLTIRVDDFKGSMERYPNANIAFGAHDTFDPMILHADSLHALIFDQFLEHEGGRDGDERANKLRAHEEAINYSAGPSPESGHYPYGTVAVLPILKEVRKKETEEAHKGTVDNEVPGQQREATYQRRAYLVVNSTRGTYTFSSYGDVRAATNPLRHIIDKHREDQDSSATLLVALIGTGQSSSMSPMASMVTLIDEFFDQRERARNGVTKFDPVADVIVSLRPKELQKGTIDLEVVHQYCAAKLKAFAAK